MNDKRDTGTDATPAVPTNTVPMSEHHREALERFVLFWGEMASTWGINRTMAQIHALLYAFEEPLDTDAVMEHLKISRGNANMNLHSLVNWNLVRKIHQPGSRKDYYTAEKDVWYITAQIIKERERREIGPVMQQLQECRDILAGDQGTDDCSALSTQEQQFCERIENLMDLMDMFDGFFQSLLPFVQKRNVPMIKQFIALAKTMQGGPSQDD
ncbi:MAG: GbsR/MarR family transcriptional regulator [Rhodothermales bacterium]